MPTADVCLILEGSYPFIAGGVSTWVHNLVEGLPDITFTAVCILPSAKEKHEYKYELPSNFIPPKVVYIHDVIKTARNPFKKIGTKQIDEIREFHNGLDEMSHKDFETIINAFQKGKYPIWDLIHGKPAWEFFLELIEEKAPNAPFMDFFWTFRFTHLPMFKALGTQLPEAKTYHAISTGYAGLLGAMARITTGRPLILTEHGIYTKERKIEIAQSEALQQDKQTTRMKIQKELGTYQQFWIAIFKTLGRITYRYAERIITLYEGNRQMQIADGASQWRTEVIPNGISLEDFQNLKPQDYPPLDQESFVVGFVGRVVPIKDVKTFIRACKTVSLTMTNVRFWIMGPTDEDEDYYDECVDLVKVLQLEDSLEFLGRVNVREYYPKLDMVVLTSISEAQPLVIMEANCAGIPVVASDVGSCRELIEGRQPEDKVLGHSGVVTDIADPADTAAGMLHIMDNPKLRKRMADAGRQRIARYYSETNLNTRYRELYQEMISLPDWNGPGGTGPEDEEQEWQV